MGIYCNHCMTEISESEKVCPACGKEVTKECPAHHLRPGTILNRKFYVGEALGEGGFGITYIGRDITLDMKVAIKEYFPNGYVNRSNTISPTVNDSVTDGRKEFFEKGRERFLSEARILAKFSGEPGIVEVRDFFEENNTAYIIMEYLDGVDLKHYLSQNGTLSAEQTIKLLMPVMKSLKKVHDQGLIHRDISLDNIMIVGDKVKLLDFGAARSVSAAANKSLSVMLKPGYAPEEQYRSKGNQGPWTDIYALCATMYKCITGITPDDATQRVFSDEVKTPSALGISISKEIETAIMRGMSVQQKDRYQNIDDLIRGLQGINVELNTSDETVAARRDVKEDDIETRYVSQEDDTPTVYGGNPDSNAGTDTNRQTEKNPPRQDAVQPVVNENKDAKNNKGLIIGISAVAGLLVVALIVVIILFANSRSSSNSPKQDQMDIPSITAPSETESEPINDANTDSDSDTDTDTDSDTDTEDVVMSDTLFDFTFELDGVVYKLPCSYDTFTKNGWTISSSGYSGDTMIGGSQYETFYMARDGHKIYVSVYNGSGNAKKISECKIGGIECETYDGASFSIAKGIVTTSTADQIKEAFGIPNTDNTGDGYESITYRQNDSSYNYAMFYISSDDKYSSIELRNFIITDEDNTETNTTKPDYLAQYKAPSGIGTDIYSGIVSVEGKVYQMPCPVSEFLDDGWTITQQSGGIVSGGTDSIRVEKDGKKTYLYLDNLSDYQTTPENCMVYEVSVSDDEGIAILLPADSDPISIGMAKANLEAILGDNFDSYAGTYSYSYSYSEYRDRDFSISISVDKETELVSSISVSCRTWEY